ncbi:MAG: hypothetical protein ACK4WH_07690 [Phycisphaerales bacterium]
MFTAYTLSVLASAAALCAASAAPAGPPSRCCDPWDNGGYDGRGAQTSQVGFNQDWLNFGRITLDDFWLCEGNVYKVETLRAVLCTDSIVPKATVVILRDCDGRPDLSPEGVVAIADSIPIVTSSQPLGFECIAGEVSITETGQTTDEGFRIIDVSAAFPGLWLKGGAYWVAVYGYSGTADPDEQFFWGFANDGVVRGRPGVFYDSEFGTLTDVDQLCCDCTDFAFCIEAQTCKILLDNGGPDVSRLAPSFASPGSVFRESRAADDVVIAPCQDRRLCFFEGYLLTNCDPPVARLEVYDNGCKLPATFSPPARFNADCLHDTGVALNLGGTRPYKLYKAQFWDLRASDGSPFVLQEGKNYWFSLYGVGTGSQIQNAYFVGAERCDLRCDGRTGRFNPAAVSGLGIGLTDFSWRSTADFFHAPFDLAFLIATDDAPFRAAQTPPDRGTRTCVVDLNNDGVVSLQDLFEFLGRWYSGCP